MADVDKALEILEQITAGDEAVQDRIDAAVAALKDDEAEVVEPAPSPSPRKEKNSE